jgi:hypothetical protein
MMLLDGVCKSGKPLTSLSLLLNEMVCVLAFKDARSGINLDEKKDVTSTGKV